ncbi:MAG: hypothetical protein ACM37W_00320 [Actinomycetota bacterium]
MKTYQELIQTCRHCGGNNISERKGTGPHYAELRCDECNRHIRWLKNPLTIEKERLVQERIAQLFKIRGSLRGWDRQFITDLYNRGVKKLSSAQFQQLQRIENEFGVIGGGDA